MIANTRLRQITAQYIAEMYNDTTANIYVYSGTMPSTQADVDNWTAGGYANQLIVTYTGFTIVQETGSPDNLVFGTFPSPATATAVNTTAADATWYVLHSTYVGLPDGTTGTGYSYHIIGTVSDAGGNGSLQLDNVTTINNGDNITVVDFNIRVARG